MNLTDSHRIVLTAAGARPNALVLPLPKSLKLPKDKVTALLRALLKNKLIVERAATADEPLWRNDPDAGRLTLVATAAGLSAVGIEPGNEVDAGAGARNKKNPRNKLAANPKRAATKLDLLIGALKSRNGATIDQLMKITGWQAHSVRGAISGALKKRLGLKVLSEAVEGKSRTYRIEARASK